jgi:hypothetical protein
MALHAAAAQQTARAHSMRWVAAAAAWVVRLLCMQLLETIFSAAEKERSVLLVVRAVETIQTALSFQARE